MIKKIVFGIIVTAYLILILNQTFAVAGGLNCTIAAACPTNFTKLLGLENDTQGYQNAHAQNYTVGAYNFSLCCKATDTSINLSNACGHIVLKLSDNNNAHVQQRQVDTYPVNACLNSTKRLPSCSYVDGACPAGTECLLSMASSGASNTTNAHVGDCSKYATKVCCQLNNTAPIIVTLIVNSTDGTNRTSQNLTAYVTTSDPDGDTVFVNYDWRYDGNSAAVVNMNFDVNNSAGSGKTRDYSASSNNGTVNNAIWNSTAGWNSSGAYQFDGDGDYIVLDHNAASPFNADFTITAWIKFKTADNFHTIVSRWESSTKEEFLFEIESGNLSFGMQNVCDDVMERLVSTSLNTDTWYHVAAVKDEGVERRIYINGIENASTSIKTANPDCGIDTYIGMIERSSWDPFNGTIDELKIYDWALSDEQILALYNNRTHIIVWNETFVGENWTACVTPNDRLVDGNTNCSTGLIIVANNPPTKVTLIAPDNESTITNRTPFFNWTAATDSDNDQITYRIQVATDDSFTVVVIDNETTDTNFTPTTELNFDDFYWRVYSNDTFAANVSDTWNFTLVTSIILTLVNGSMDFEQLSAGQTNATDDNSPRPFHLRNDGNVEVNVSINASSLFSAVGLNNPAYRYKADNATESDGAFSWSASDTTYTNMQTSANQFLRIFNHSNNNDEAEIDIQITVPNDEPTGEKNSTVEFTGVVS